MDSVQPSMRVDFPRWKEGDPTGWLSCAECYFRYHRTPVASIVDIATIHLEGDAIQWYNWLKHTQGVPTWRRFKSGLLIHFGPSEYENIDEHEEEDLEHEEEVTKEDPQLAECMVHALVGYVNP
ncbi:hypothetical protein GW17_00053409 [Ensete ventricosum]|nr:hypothetical protein GW17_00053409 [Ensete ventricosum]